MDFRGQGFVFPILSHFPFQPGKGLHVEVGFLTGLCPCWLHVLGGGGGVPVRLVLGMPVSARCSALQSSFALFQAV